MGWGGGIVIGSCCVHSGSLYGAERKRDLKGLSWRKTPNYPRDERSWTCTPFMDAKFAWFVTLVREQLRHVHIRTEPFMKIWNA